MLIHRRMAPAPLLDKVVVSLDMAGIVAGCKFRGEARELFRRIISFYSPFTSSSSSSLLASLNLFDRRFFSSVLLSLVRRATEEPACRGGAPRRSAGRLLHSHN